MILASSSFAVLLNGVQGKKFYCKRVVRQGDQLSPLLFVLEAELLQSILNKENCSKGIYPCPYISMPSETTL
jgi:hypothetical protein